MAGGSWIDSTAWPALSGCHPAGQMIWSFQKDVTLGKGKRERKNVLKGVWTLQQAPKNVPFCSVIHFTSHYMNSRQNTE